MTWPITIADVNAAQQRITTFLSPTPLRSYGALDAAVGHDLRVLVKHENHQPTNAFKVRNGLSALSLLAPEVARRGVITASRGNHGLGLAWAGARLEVPVTVCVPARNSPGKNAAIRHLGAELVEAGEDYDASLEVAARLMDERRLHLVHSTNDRGVIAGAGTMTREILDAAEELDALVLSVGGGSQAVGALTVVRALAPHVAVYGVQAAGASAICDSWHAGRPLEKGGAHTFADGLATRSTYELTFPALREGLTDFVKVEEEALAHAVRLLLETTHNLAEGAGAAGLAGLLELAPRLAGKRVAIAITGSNIDADVLRRVLGHGDCDT